jgi:hypothetical protein
MFGGWMMPAYFFRSEPGVAELRRLARRESGRVCQRVLMIANLLEGMEHEAAARLAGLSRSAAYKWHNRYEEEGIEGLRDRPRSSAANTSPPSTRARARARNSSENQRPWPADKVERWSIDRLIPYAKNARTHTDAQVAAIAASIKEWGWTTPALVGEDGGLIAGHARVLAARQLGIVKIPVMVAAGWTEAQKRAYVLADNQLAITGSGWDPELLRLELGELKLGGFDLSLTGFGDLELKPLHLICRPGPLISGRFPAASRARARAR